MIVANITRAAINAIKDFAISHRSILDRIKFLLLNGQSLGSHGWNPEAHRFDNFNNNDIIPASTTNIRNHTLVGIRGIMRQFGNLEAGTTHLGSYRNQRNHRNQKLIPRGL